MRLHDLRQLVPNALAVAAATLGWVLMAAWFHSRESDLLGPEVSGVFLVWVLPLLVECLAAVGAGAAMAHLLRTEHPVLYGILLGSAHILYRWMMMTIGEPGWQGAVLIATDLLLPALVAATVTAWLYRRREARTLPVA